MGKSNLADDAVRGVILAAAPERKDELSKLWEEHKPQIELVDDKWKFTMNAGGFDLVRFDNKTMCQVWIFGFVAQKSFHMYSAFLLLSQIYGVAFCPDHLDDEIYRAQYAEAENIFSVIDELFASEKREDGAWPSSIPEPESGKPSDENEAMAYDLLCIAIAYLFLHEIQHIVFSHSETRPDSHQEEYACDEYARNFLMEKIELYSNDSGYDEEMVRTKRAMAIALASVLILAITPVSLWPGSSSHPPVCQRIRDFTDSCNVSDRSHLWIYLSSLLLFILIKNKVKIEASAIPSQKEYCFKLLEFLDAYLNQKSE